MVEIRFEPERRLVSIRCRGPLKGSETIQAMRELVRDPRFRTGTSVVVDLRAVVAIELFGEEVRAASEQLSRLGDAFVGSRIAIVAASDASFGISRQFELLQADARWEVRAFRALEEARRWLGLEEEE